MRQACVRVRCVIVALALITRVARIQQVIVVRGAFWTADLRLEVIKVEVSGKETPLLSL